MIILTGAAGFIGSNMLAKLNNEGFKDIVIADDFNRPEKENNWKDKTFSHKINRDELFDFIIENQKYIQFIVHIGARTNTAEFDTDLLNKLNTEYTQKLWSLSVQFGLPFIYASSAATYGDGELGYDDNHDIIFDLKPLNPYGCSKNDFDKWAVKQEKQPYFWAGFKFFNVYGPNEYHKGRMASVIMHAHKQIIETNSLKLFKSHKPEYLHGGQKRDFIYVKDVVDVLFFFMKLRNHSGLYNLGTGTARTFLDLGKGVFKAMKKNENISFIDTPVDIRDKYQYYTCAEMQKLRNAGYQKPFTSLEEGINDYVNNYLSTKKYV